MIVEVWRDGESCLTAFPEPQTAEERRKVMKQFEDSNPVLLHRIVATDWVDAMKQYHKLMDWEDYVPMDE